MRPKPMRPEQIMERVSALVGLDGGIENAACEFPTLDIVPLKTHWQVYTRLDIDDYGIHQVAKLLKHRLQHTRAGTHAPKCIMDYFRSTRKVPVPWSCCYTDRRGRLVEALVAWQHQVRRETLFIHCFSICRPSIMASAILT